MRALRKALSGRAAARPTRALRKALSGRGAAGLMRALRKALSGRGAALLKPELWQAQPEEWRWRQIGRLGNGAAAACAAAAILVFCGVGFAGVPGLGRVLDPGHGAWTSAAGDQV